MRRSLLLPGIVAAAAFAILIALGVWQLERKAWKESLIATLAERMSAKPLPLSSRGQWQDLAPAADEFRHVRLRLQFDPKREARVYSGGAGLRDDVKAPGYFAFAPARLPDGSTVVVNRGHVDNPTPDASLKPIAVPDSAVDSPVRCAGRNRRAGSLRPIRSGRTCGSCAITAPWLRIYGWGEVAPFYIEMESPAPAGGVPRPGPLTVKLRNDHLGYALTWFGLAAVLLGVFAVWARSRKRAGT